MILLVSTTLVFILFLSNSVCGESPPVISPAGYNTSVNDDLAVEFRCTASLNAQIVGWILNGISTDDRGSEYLEASGIEVVSDFILENGTKFQAIRIAARSINDNTSIQCVVVYLDFSVGTSEMVIFRIQGVLSEPTGLTAMPYNSTHDILKWQDPPTLNLTDQEPDIMAYNVSLIMQQPPPLYPYHSPPFPANFTTHSFVINSSDSKSQFPFLRYSFPVQLTVGAVNPSGVGNMSQQFTTQLHTNCTRVFGVSPGHETRSKVVFVDSSPLLEVHIAQLPSKTMGRRYCFDSVELEVYGEGGGTLLSTHVRVTQLSDSGSVYVREPDLLQDSHLTARLLFNSTEITQTNFSTFSVQGVEVRPVSSVLTVKCVFAEGSTEDTCHVILESGSTATAPSEASGSKFTFTGLAEGSYTVTVYDSEPETSGSGTAPPTPAVQTVVTISGGGLVSPTTPAVPATPSVSLLPSSSPTVVPPDGGTGLDLVTVIVIIATPTGTILILGVLLVMILFKRCRHRTLDYSVEKAEKRQQQMNALNPLVALARKESQEEGAQGEGTYDCLKPQQDSSSLEDSQHNAALISVEPGYEELDAEKAKTRWKNKEAAEVKPYAEVRKESVMEESVSGVEKKEPLVLNHTYSKVTKQPKQRESSPPPIPPKLFPEDGVQEEEHKEKEPLVLNHTYSKVTKQPKHHESSPPPIPPKLFPEDSVQELPVESHLLEDMTEPKLLLQSDSQSTEPTSMGTINLYDSISSPPVGSFTNQPGPFSLLQNELHNSQSSPLSPPKLPHRPATSNFKDPVYESIKSLPAH